MLWLCFSTFKIVNFWTKKKYWCSSNWILMHRSVIRIAFLGPIMQLSLPHMHSVTLNGKSNWWLIITQAARLKTNLMKHGLLWTNLYYDDQNVKTNSEMLFSRYNFLLSWIDFPLVPSARCWKEKHLSPDWILFSSQIKPKEDNLRQMFDSPTIVALKPAFPTLLLDWNLSTCKPKSHIFIKRQTFDWTLITDIYFVQGFVL